MPADRSDHNVPKKGLFARGLLAGRYRLEAELGQGGMGQLFRGVDVQSGEPVAIKELKPEVLATDPGILTRFEREGQALRQLNHPNIVKMLAAVSQDEGHYLIMEYVDGGDLRQLLDKEAPLPISQTAEIGLDLADALTRAHRLNILHRDVKPANVLLTAGGRPKLTDFGLAHMAGVTALTQTGAVVGTVAYLSPEAINGQPLDERTDIWSFGVLLYEMLAGEHPFSAETLSESLAAILNQPLPDLDQLRPDIPDSLVDLIYRMLEKERSARVPSVRLVGAELEAILHEVDRPELASQIAAATQTQRDEEASAGQLEREGEIGVRMPAFLDAQDVEQQENVPLFVGRQTQLARLGEFLEQAIDGQGQVAFISGGTGRGKSALMEAFGRGAMDKYPDLLVAQGRCNAYSGMGDPYLPFRDLLAMLTGDVEAQWAAGAIDRSQARRLWEAMPLVTASFLEKGPGLVGTLFSGNALLTRLSAAAPGSTIESRARERISLGPSARDMDQNQLFDQVTQALRAVAVNRPLLLMLDDMQWADNASTALLFHLGRRLQGARILILVAYRPEELAGDREGARHPLEKLLAEFKRRYGPVWVDLGQEGESEAQAFVDALIDAEPNQLGESFRRAFFEHVGGHPLFAVEMLRSMRERGDLVQTDGEWFEGPSLDWGALPMRVEGVIEERIGRLEDELLDILTVAAVEGQSFTAQVVAQVQEIQERKLLRTLSRQLERQYRLVHERTARMINRRQLLRYDFAHVLFQRYLYNNLSAGERTLLHGEVGRILEELYEGRLDEIAVQLARHYAEAGDSERAVPYLLKAGDKARSLYAFEDALGHYQRAVDILKREGDSERTAQSLMKLALTYHNLFDFQRAGQVYEEAFVFGQQSFSPSPPPTLPPAPHALRVAFEDLHSYTTASDSGEDLWGALYSGLFRMSPDFAFEPDMAASWQILDGGRTYIFHLRRDALWSDGRPVTAGDFVRGWHRALDPVHSWHEGELLYDVKGAAVFHQGQESDGERLGISAPDDYTLRLELEQPAGYFLQLLAYSSPLPRPDNAVDPFDESWKEPGNSLTNGPFKLASWRKGDSIILERNPTYHGQFRGNVDRVEVRLGQDVENMYALYQAGALDIFLGDPSAFASGDHDAWQHATELMTAPAFSTHWLRFNVKRPPFDDRRVRQAFVLALDRKAMGGGYAAEHFRPATGGIVSPGLPGHVPDIALPYDPERAQKLLAEAGYPDGQGFPTITALQDSYIRWDHERISRDWKSALGVKIDWQILEFHDFIEQEKRADVHLRASGWLADYPDPDTFLRVSLALNSDWRHEVYFGLVERARVLMDHPSRMRLYRQAEEILVLEAPIVPVAYISYGHGLVKPWIRNYRHGIEGSWRWQDIIIDPH